MYKVLVVDDEPIIVDGISELLRDYSGCEFDVYTAYSGSEALEILRQTKIDILLTDIKMPKTNGFVLQKEVLEHWPDCRVIFLTGHNEFELIQSAMRNKSVDYILKSEGEQIILDTLVKTVKEIEEEKDRKYLVENARKYLKKALPYMQKEFINELVTYWKGTKEELEETFFELGIMMETDLPVIMILGRVDSFTYRKSYTEILKLMVSIQDIMMQNLGSSFYCISSTYQQHKMIWLVQPMKPAAYKSWDPIIQSIYDILEDVRKKCSDILKVSTSFITADTPATWDDCFLQVLFEKSCK